MSWELVLEQIHYFRAMDLTEQVADKELIVIISAIIFLFARKMQADFSRKCRSGSAFTFYL